MVRRNGFAIERVDDAAVKGERVEYAVGDRVLVRVPPADTVLGPLALGPETVGKIVGCEGVLDCCRDPTQCYSVMVRSDGEEFVLCVRAQNLFPLGAVH